MKTFGLLGGMSWESSIEYERIINKTVREQLGGTASADLIIRSFNFAEIEALQEAGEWTAAATILAEAAGHLAAAGAGAIVICTNTMHRLADTIQATIDVPILHIADATARSVQDAGLETVGLLGTRYTMEQDFYRGRLRERHGLTVVTPDAASRAVVHDVIYDELVRGIVSDESRRRYLAIIDKLTAAGAQGVIAGCTEIELLISPADLEIPLFPTARIHAEAAARYALGLE